eukprot:CAMPEP_0204304624 /NCGR_PEP_ID=MMETSP0468-20130131/84508_1 /ASSEMBLY_ACC=CAM_ASM_000383 /TAXON_ID=2969 /ORGANISM="Oxyrrhis marina" /LENGTH=464 /DNA_ID=CAMNT_0051283949 /DNA_START=65 /DNA_END=1460 /DNA_ORIENTATION=-
MRVLVASLVTAAQAQIDPATVVEIGKEIYEAIKDNQPVIDTTVDWAGAVPKGVTNWTQLENWQGPAQTDGYYIEFKDLGKKLTKFAWRFVWKYGGDMNGVGKYVTQAGIDIDTAYAYLSEHLDVEVNSLKPVNYGTSANPVGGVDIQVSVSSHGLFEKTTKVCTMTVKGDGTSALGTCEHGTFGHDGTAVVVWSQDGRAFFRSVLRSTDLDRSFLAQPVHRFEVTRLACRSGGGVDIQVSVSSHGLFEKTTKVCTMTVKGDGTSALGTCEHGTFGQSKPSNDLPAIDPSTVVEIGKEIYQAIEDNQPTLNTTIDWAGAVPKGVTEWTQLENWQGPAQSDSYYVEFKNGLGKKLTKFAWQFVWKYGGDMNGVGKYVTQAGIDIDTSYAYLSEHLDVEVKSLKPVNYGTSDAPVGGVDIQVSVSSHGLFEKTTKVCTMTVKGDGTSALGTCEHGTFGHDGGEAVVV